jgi:hypothetical protein
MFIHLYRNMLEDEEKFHGFLDEHWAILPSVIVGGTENMKTKHQL